MKWTAKLKGTEWKKKKKKAIPKYRNYKYKIYEKEDPEKKPIIFRGAEMIFANKFSMLWFYGKISKEFYYNVEWGEV